jgi:hypothetical protein
MSEAITIGLVRFSYAHVWEPYTPPTGGDPKYSVTMLIPKSDANTLNLIMAKIEEAKTEGASAKWSGKIPAMLRLPIYDGDGPRPSGELFGEECRGHYVLTAKSSSAPSVVDAGCQPILNKADFYSGCYGYASINFFAYNQGSNGVGCGLNHVMKKQDGEPLAGGISVEEAFKAVAAAGTPYSGAQYAGIGAGMPATPGAATMGYTAPVPGVPPVYQPPQGYGAGAQQIYAQPAPQTNYATPGQSIDPITGRPMLSGGVMGIG